MITCRPLSLLQHTTQPQPFDPLREEIKALKNKKSSPVKSTLACVYSSDHADASDDAGPSLNSDSSLTMAPQTTTTLTVPPHPSPRATHVHTPPQQAVYPPPSYRLPVGNASDPATDLDSESDTRDVAKMAVMPLKQQSSSSESPTSSTYESDLDNGRSSSSGTHQRCVQGKADGGGCSATNGVGPRGILAACSEEMEGEDTEEEEGEGEGGVWERLTGWNIRGDMRRLLTVTNVANFLILLT